MSSNLFETLQERGYIYQSTDMDKLKEVLNGEPTTFYLGIDPTASSLHIGHFFALMLFKHLQEAGHKGIILVGGATASVGDPSGKSDMRKMMTQSTLDENIAGIKASLQNIINFEGTNPAIIVNNADWINSYNYIEFMRHVGVHFNVNKMLSAEAYSSRIEQGGLTFLEMGYMLMQAFDFVHLNKEFGCKLQIGGSDQWGNIAAGVTLNRKMNNLEEDTKFENDLVALTCPLLMNSEGKKMGKTEKGALWIAKERTSPFDFYQYFYNVNDKDVEKLLKVFTKIELSEINNLVNTDIINAKKVMAYEITKLVHGTEEADNVIKAVSSLYGKSTNLDTVPAHKMDKPAIVEGISLLDLLHTVGLAPTKSEARRNVEQGGVSINGEKITDSKYIVDEKDIDTENDIILIKKGKKNFLKITF